MLGWFFENRIAASERSLGVPLDYMRYVARHSTAAAIRMARFVKLAQFPSTLPAEALAVAGVAGSMGDDCGTCVQIAVNISRQQGVSAEILREVVNRNPDALSEDLRDIYHFAEATLTFEGPDDELRERIRRRWGDRGLIDLSMAIAMHRVYPTFKRALGYAKSCSLVTVSV